MNQRSGQCEVGPDLMASIGLGIHTLEYGIPMSRLHSWWRSQPQPLQVTGGNDERFEPKLNTFFVFL